MKDFSALWRQAEEAGRAAAAAAVPEPMVIVDNSSGYTYPPILDGVCGFAWVQMPGNTAFARWGRKEGLLSSHYPSGVSYWISHYNQSMTRKEAHARAFAATLQAAGIKCYAGSRMD